MIFYMQLTNEVRMERIPKTDFQKVHQENKDEKICVIFHMPYILSVVLHIRHETRCDVIQAKTSEV